MYRKPRKGIAGTIVRTGLVRLELGPDFPQHPPQAAEFAADQLAGLACEVPPMYSRAGSRSPILADLLFASTTDSK